MFNYLSIFGKLRVDKIFMPSKISHIAAFLPSQAPCIIFDNKNYKFIRGKNQQGVSDQALSQRISSMLQKYNLNL